MQYVPYIIIMITSIIIFFNLKRIAVLKRNINLDSKLQENIKNLENQNNELNTQLEKKDKKIKYLNEDLEDLESSRNKERNRAEQLKLEIEILEQKREEKQKEYDLLVKKCNYLEDSLSSETEERKKIENIFMAIINILSTEKIKNDIYEQLNNYINTHPKNKSDIMFTFFNAIKKELIQLSDLTTNDEISNKMIVAVGGSFSSGKSSFLNTLFEEKKILPTGDLPVTSIPSYIMNTDNNPIIECLTKYDQKSSIDENIFNLISTKNSVNSSALNPKHIIKHFYIKNKLKENFKNICFVDTPGYNPANESKDDEDLAREHIAKTNKLIWLINIKAGTITDSDIKFLKSVLELNGSISIYVLITRADEKTDSDIKAIVKEIKEKLNDYKINVMGITPYTSKSTELSHNQYYFTNYGIGISLEDFLGKNVDNYNTHYNIKRNISNIINIHKENYRVKKSYYEQYQSYIVNINKTYISDLAEKDKAIFKYKSLVPAQYLNYEKINIEDIDNEEYLNNKNINEYLNKFKKYYNKKIDNYKDCILELDELHDKITNYIDDIFIKK